MFAHFVKIPMYNNRDGFAGNRVEQLPGYVFETKALALRKLPSDYDDEGDNLGVHHFVADVSDPHRRPITNTNSNLFSMEEDIPF